MGVLALTIALAAQVSVEVLPPTPEPPTPPPRVRATFAPKRVFRPADRADDVCRFDGRSYACAAAELPRFNRRWDIALETSLDLPLGAGPRFRMNEDRRSGCVTGVGLVLKPAAEDVVIFWGSSTLTVNGRARPIVPSGILSTPLKIRAGSTADYVATDGTGCMAVLGPQPNEIIIELSVSLGARSEPVLIELREALEPATEAQAFTSLPQPATPVPPVTEKPFPLSLAIGIPGIAVGAAGTVAACASPFTVDSLGSGGAVALCGGGVVAMAAGFSGAAFAVASRGAEAEQAVKHQDERFTFDVQQRRLEAWRAKRVALGLDPPAAQAH